MFQSLKETIIKKTVAIVDNALVHKSRAFVERFSIWQENS